MDPEAISPPAAPLDPSTNRKAGLSVCYALADQDFHRTKSLGIFNLSVGLLAALARHPAMDRLHVLANRHLAGFVPREARVGSSEHNAALRGTAGRIWWDQAGVARAARRAGCAWTFLPKGFAPWWTPLPPNLACYVHDTIQVFYRDHYPRSFSRLDRIYFTISLRRTLARSRVVFTNSGFSREQLLGLARAAGRPAPPVIVAGIGFDPPSPVAAGSRGGIVCLASRWPHKRTDLALRYLDAWQRATGYADPVTWIGHAPAGLSWPAYPNWRRRERPDQAEYAALLSGSRALVFFSEYEGFGMPPVEAVLQGACPVYSRIPATAEVMGELGEGFDNEDYGTFRNALDRALGTRAEVVARWAEVLLARFSWAAVADRVVDGLNRLSDASGGGARKEHGP